VCWRCCRTVRCRRSCLWGEHVQRVSVLTDWLPSTTSERLLPIRNYCNVRPTYRRYYTVFIASVYSWIIVFYYCVRKCFNIVSKLVKTKLENSQVSLEWASPWNVIFFPSVLWRSWSGVRFGCWFVGGDDLTGAFHFLQLQLLPPFRSSIASIKTSNPVSPPGKWPLKRRERERERVNS